MAGLIERISPSWALRREYARARLARGRALRKLQTRGYDGASGGRRLNGWLATDTAPAGASPMVLDVLRRRSRDLGRNSSVWAGALQAIESEVVGRGIRGKVTNSPTLEQAWKDWAETTACDADGRLTFYGIQRLVMRGIAESGEVIIRRRRRSSGFSLPVPMQVQVLESDMIADDLLGLGGPGNSKSGVTFDRRGQRTGYILHKEHPSAIDGINRLQQKTITVPAEDIIHVYRVERPGQIRGIPWSANVMTDIRLYDDYIDATIEAARVAACYAAFVTEPDPSMLPQVVADPATGETDQWEQRLEPGMISHLTPGQDVKFGVPPTRGDEKFIFERLTSIATGAGLPYELISKDLSKVNFTSGRMGRLDFAKTVRKWQHEILLAHVCARVWSWFVEASAGVTTIDSRDPAIRWTTPRPEMVDPQKETAANKERVRSGFATWAEVVREQGYDPDEVLAETEHYNAEFDRLGIVYDSDPRNMSQAGQSQATQTGTRNEQTQTNETQPQAVREGQGGEGFSDAAE